MIKTDKTLAEVKILFEQGKLKSYSQCDYTGKVSYVLKKEEKIPVFEDIKEDIKELKPAKKPKGKYNK